MDSPRSQSGVHTTLLCPSPAVWPKDSFISPSLHHLRFLVRLPRALAFQPGAPASSSTLPPPLLSASTASRHHLWSLLVPLWLLNWPVSPFFCHISYKAPPPDPPPRIPHLTHPHRPPLPPGPLPSTDCMQRHWWPGVSLLSPDSQGHHSLLRMFARLPVALTVKP